MLTCSLPLTTCKAPITDSKVLRLRNKYCPQVCLNVSIWNLKESQREGVKGKKINCKEKEQFHTHTSLSFNSSSLVVIINSFESSKHYDYGALNYPGLWPIEICNSNL